MTTDALLTQRTFCKEVLEHQADYALPVKENHKQMYDDIQQLFEPLSETDATEVETRRFENLHTQEGAHLHTYTHVETSHGLTTTRTLTASTLLTDYIKWPGIAQVYQYQSQRENTKTAGDLLADAVWHHESLTRSRIRRRLAQTPTRTLDDRKQSPLGPRHRSRGGRFTGENREYTTSHRSITQHCHVCFTLRRTHKNL